MKKIALVVPCYNEEAVLPRTGEMLLGELDRLVAAGKVSSDSFVLFSNDGSTDSTWRIISDLAAKNPRVKGISLSRNRGHQNALLAGLMTAKAYADMVISMDADLQDDINVVDQFVEI